ncbi:MAG TPA: hypothetical protein HA254_03350 [Candidatus Diapherotrites archaeon]|uniref:50S ribosomal protein L39e n=1 Tax=Candidatus Iainarchaeum sp. TaxID=3101447 RepID=A0A7J4IXV4_9ARCH|nr:hypothetical protein [Candidatus Diapherotrites archaeon]
MGRKTQEEKEFLIAVRKRTGSGAINAPAWILQKAGKRIWNKKAKRHWRETNFGNEFRKTQKEQGRSANTKHAKSGRKNKSRMLKTKTSDHK